MAILTVVVGLLLVTCAFLIGYGFCAGQNDIELLKSDYLAQVAETGAREVFRLPETAANVLRVQRFRRPARQQTLIRSRKSLINQRRARSGRIRGAGMADQT